MTSIVSIKANTSPRSSALQKGVDGAMAAVKKVQQRRTEDVRVEDAIVDMKVEGSDVVVTYDDRSFARPDGIKSRATALLRTLERRPDLLAERPLTPEEQALLREFGGDGSGPTTALD